jgi:hypothetical protein
MENNVLVGGKRLTTHDRDTCKGEYCTIHNFSDHHMVKWNQRWREDRSIMERICGHGVGHPDPDDPKAQDEFESVHGCDGCCNPASQFDKDIQELTKQYKKPDYLTPTSLGPFYSSNPIEIPTEDFFSDEILIKLEGLSIRKTNIEEMP